MLLSFSDSMTPHLLTCRCTAYRATQLSFCFRSLVQVSLSPPSFAVSFSVVLSKRILPSPTHTNVETNLHSIVLPLLLSRNWFLFWLILRYDCSWFSLSPTAPTQAPFPYIKQSPSLYYSLLLISCRLIFLISLEETPPFVATQMNVRPSFDSVSLICLFFTTRTDYVT